MYTTNNYIAVEPFIRDYKKRYKSAGKIINKTGYLKNKRTNTNPYNIIPTNYITTNGMIDTPIVTYGLDKNYNIVTNSKILYPNTGNYQYPKKVTNVLEIPLYHTLFAQAGGDINNNTQQQQDTNIYLQKELPAVEITADKPIWLKDKETKTPDKVKHWWNPFTWGKKIRKNDILDYSDYTNYESAYQNANRTDRKNFMYNGHMYETKTGELTHGLSYRESKRFLKKYLKDSYPYDNLDSIYQRLDREIPIYQNIDMEALMSFTFDENGEPVNIKVSNSNKDLREKAMLYTHELSHKGNKKRPKAMDFIRNTFMPNKHLKRKYVTDEDEILARVAAVKAQDYFSQNKGIYTPAELRKWKDEYEKTGNVSDKSNMIYLLDAYGDTNEGLDDLASLLNNNFHDFGYEGPYKENDSFNYEESANRKERRKRRQNLRRLARNMSNID